MPAHCTRYQKTLVDAFFYGQDQQVLEAFRERKEKMDRRAQLTQVSGIRDVEPNADREAINAQVARRR
jgi:hypothetical protein